MFSLVEYEAVADAAPVDAGAAEPVDTFVDSDPGDVTDAPDATPDAPVDPLAGIDLDAIRALAEVAPSLLQQRPPEQNVQQATPNGGFLDGVDPNEYLNPLSDNFGENLLNVLNVVAERAQQPYRDMQEQEEASRSQELLKDAAHDLETKKGEFIGDDAAKQFARSQMLQVARQVFPEIASRYGNTDRAADLALERAYDTVKGIQDSIAKAAVEQHVNRNARLADQHVAPGLGGASGIETTPAVVLSPRELALKYGNRASALRE